MSLIRYRFKSSKDFDTISFEGHGLHVWEVKDEIFIAKKLTKSVDFDLALTNAQTNEEYTDENKMIAKNTSVIVRRVPRTGSSFRINRHNANPMQQPRPSPASNIPKAYSLINAKAEAGKVASSTHIAAEKPISMGMISKNKEEEAKLQAMVKSSSEEWNKQLDMQETFGSERFSTRRYGTTMQSKVPHPNYVCYRCGEKGHFINDCPILLANPNDQTRIKRVTGIPKSFLKPVADANTNSLKKTMISYDGSKVVFTPNTFEWQKFSSLATSASAKTQQDSSSLGAAPTVEDLHHHQVDDNKSNASIDHNDRIGTIQTSKETDTGITNKVSNGIDELGGVEIQQSMIQSKDSVVGKVKNVPTHKSRINPY